MLDFSSNMTSKLKIDRSGVSGMSVSGGHDTRLSIYIQSYERIPAQWRPFWVSRSSDFMPRIFLKALPEL